MLRSHLIGASLAGLLLASGFSSAAVAADAPAVGNVGFVLYTKSYAPGVLNARWMYGGKYSGPGIATGGPREGPGRASPAATTSAISSITASFPTSTTC